MNKKRRCQQVDQLLESFGLSSQAHTPIGTVFRKSLSDGQKRRVAVARQLVTSPKILFLDEPTSGLDSAASFEVVQYLQQLARSNNIVVLCSIHQPSTATLNLFDKLLLMSTGKLLYNGPVSNVTKYFSERDVEIPLHTNPAEYLLDLVNVDFTRDSKATAALMQSLEQHWKTSADRAALNKSIEESRLSQPVQVNSRESPRIGTRLAALLHRSLIKALRDPLAYGIRYAFSFCFSILVGTVWLYLHHDQGSIQPLTSEIFFVLCFMSVSALIYGPAFIEDYLLFVHDRRNASYGPAEFALSNLVIAVPYVITSSFMFALVAYWLTNPTRTAGSFFTWVLWISLTSFAAEGLLVFTVAVYSDFMFVIAVFAFLNCLLLCSQGFFISKSNLTPFYRYLWHYWNYLTYSFQELMVLEFKGVQYDCGEGCQCVFNSPLAKQCKVAGEAILQQYNVPVDARTGASVGIVIAIGLGYRLAAYLLFRFKN